MARIKVRWTFEISFNRRQFFFTSFPKREKVSAMLPIKLSTVKMHCLSLIAEAIFLVTFSIRIHQERCLSAICTPKHLTVLTLSISLPSILMAILERFRFRFQYLYRYLSLSFSQSDVLYLPCLKIGKKVAVVVEEVKSEPLYYHGEHRFSVGIQFSYKLCYYHI